MYVWSVTELALLKIVKRNPNAPVPGVTFTTNGTGVPPNGTVVGAGATTDATQFVKFDTAMLEIKRFWLIPGFAIVYVNGVSAFATGANPKSSVPLFAFVTPPRANTIPGFAGLPNRNDAACPVLKFSVPLVAIVVVLCTRKFAIVVGVMGDVA
jgi:hypothetical protein